MKMKIDLNKDESIEAGGFIKLKAKKDHLITIRVTDADVDINLGRVVIRCQKAFVREIKKR